MKVFMKVSFIKAGSSQIQPNYVKIAILIAISKMSNFDRIRGLNTQRIPLIFCNFTVILHLYQIYV